MTLFLPPTPFEWVLFFCVFFGLGSFVAASEFIRARLNGSPEITRKLVHVVTGVLICFAPRIFTSGIPPMLLAASFMVINFGAIRFGLLKGMHGTNRVSFGTVYYPFSFFMLVLLAWDSAPYIITISILVLALGDAAAAIVGEHRPHPHMYALTSDKKSVEGSAAMFLVTFAVLLAGLHWVVPSEITLPMPSAVIAASIALFVTAWEAISSQGSDNLTVPLSAGFALDYFLTPLPHHIPAQFVTGLVLALAIVLLSYRFRFLSASGAAATFILATIIFGIGGWMWTVPIVTFFILSSMLSKLSGRTKREAELLFEKSGRRDAGQVAANGGVAGAVIVFWYMFPQWDSLYAAYVGALAAAAADTWGTEIGTLLGKQPRSIVSLEKVPPGTSGGVSMAGLAAGVLGALVVGMSAAAVFNEPQKYQALLTGALAGGLCGTITDSMLGATLQARYRCVCCCKHTERPVHCEKPAVPAGGISWITNDLVNWACAAAGGTAALAAYL